MARLVLRHALLADGTTTDVAIADGLVEALGPAITADGDDVVDLDGRLLLPAPAEPHAHLDKAFLAERIDNPTGDLLGAIVGMEEHRHLLTVPDIVERGERAARLLAANGVTAVRTHADTTLEGGLQSIEGLVEVRRRVADVIDVQVVALASWPISGPAGAGLRALVRDAVAMGADLVGGCPHLEDDPAAANETLLALAAELDRPLDLHTDETLDPAMCSLADLARRVIRDRFPHAVTASHCVSLGMQPADQQRATAELVAEAAIGVVVLPQTNLYLQGRDHGTGTPRGLTAIRALREAGAPVAAGADNLQDPFNPVGRGDPLETAALMVMAGHQLPEVAYESVSTEARRVLGLAPAGLTPGASADLVAVRAATVREAVAFGPPARLVIRHGHVVSTGERA